jgi:ubiquinone/menaquinone biosynthesis C-methylase UbiE
MTNDDSVKITQRTYDSIASEYSACVDRLVSGWIQGFEKLLLDELIKKLPPNGKILEIGCGNGKDTEYLIEKDLSVIATDISSGMLSEAIKRVPAGDFIQMDMRNLSFPNESFDWVTANGCIYHVSKADFKGVLKEIFRVLKPDGPVSFNFKIGKGEGLEQNPVSFKGGPRYFSYYTIREMIFLLVEAGFILDGFEEYPEEVLEERIAYIWARKM